MGDFHVTLPKSIIGTILADSSAQQNAVLPRLTRFATVAA